MKQGQTTTLKQQKCFQGSKILRNKYVRVMKISTMTQPLKMIYTVKLWTLMNSFKQHKSVPLPKMLSINDGVTTNSATATHCVSLYDLRGIH